MSTDYGYENQPYFADMLKLARTYVGKPGMYHLMVEHDDWCPVLHGTGLCVCNPTVRRPNRKERRQIEKRYGKEVSHAN